MSTFNQKIKELFEINKSSLRILSPDFEQHRENALDDFLTNGLPDKHTQGWQECRLKKKVSNSYTLKLQPDDYQPMDHYFKCKVHDLRPIVLPVRNGWFVSEESKQYNLPDGVIACGLNDAIQKFPDLVAPYVFADKSPKHNGLISLNETFFNDGVFIYIPDNVKVETPIQIISLVDANDNLLINNKYVIVLGENAELSVIQCDDSVKKENSFTNNLTQIYLNKNSRLQYYKTENKDSDSLLVNSVIVNQKQESEFKSTAITFNAGYICNSLNVNLNEPFAKTELHGLYLVDKQQVCDNHIFVNHAAPDCKSIQVYKGIMDDEAKADFHGHILVAADSQRTSASQTNRNLLLTDKARVTAKPFLEIYADDVQCSHGATVGQLDEEALYYLRTRGIGEASANRLLMFAFANDIVQNVEIEALRDRLSNMVQHRLQGELNVCSQCMLSDDITFPIQL